MTATHPGRRRVTPLCGAAVLALTLTTLAACGGSAADEETLTRSPVAARRPVLGTAVNGTALASDARYRRLLAGTYASVTPENEMKWEFTEPARGQFDFTAADAIVKFARQHGQQVHGHTLVWGNRNPAWLVDGHFSREQLINILKHHIDTVVGHYRGQVASWDVVNEAVANDGQLQHNVWLDGIGPGYIDMAFRFAHAADPDTRLFYNDNGGEVPGLKATAIHQLVAGLVDRGVPIDGVGLQMHTTTTPAPHGPVATGALDYRPSVAGLAETFRTYRALGLDVAVTEMDVWLRLPPIPSDLLAQAGVYRDVLDACRKAPNCTAFTTWGFTDRYSWIPQWKPGTGAALPFDAAFRPKPAASVLP
jgi:endo-1,4-beta-xylanase